MGMMHHCVDGLATGLEVAGDTASAVKKLVFHFSFLFSLGLWSTLTVGLSTSVNLVQELPHSHVYSLVS